jgi:hypothetical protein
LYLLPHAARRIGRTADNQSRNYLPKIHDECLLPAGHSPLDSQVFNVALAKVSWHQRELSLGSAVLGIALPWLEF